MLTDIVTKNCQNIYRRAWLYLFFLVLLVSVAAFSALNLPLETSLESMVLEDDPDLIFYQKFKQQFGEDEFLVVGFSVADVFAPEILQFIREQTARLEALPEVREVVSLTNVDEFVGADNDFIVRPLVGEIKNDPKVLALLRQRALSSHLIRDSLLAKAGTATLLLLRPHSFTATGGDKAALVEKVKRIFAGQNTRYPKLEYHLAGWLVTDAAMSAYMNRDLALFVPLTYIVLAVFLWLALRNFRAVFIALVNILFCLVSTLALLHLVGGSLNPVTAILLPLMMALAVSDSIHLFVDFFARDRSSGDLPEIMLKTVKSLALPCFLTSLTTAIGFIALAVSVIPPIRSFGLAAAGGMILEFGFSMTIIPLGIYFLRKHSSLRRRPRLGHGFMPAILEKLVFWVTRRYRAILWGAILLTVIAFYGSLRLTVATDLLSYFKNSSPVHQGARFVDEHLGGVNTLEISCYAAEPDAILQPENLAVLDKIERFLRAQPQVSQVTSINNFLKEMNRAFYDEAEARYELPQSKALAAQYLLLYDGSELENFVDSEYQRARLSARITAHDSRIVEKLNREVRNYIRTELAGSTLEIRVTGKTVLTNKLIKDIVDSQIQSLVLATGLIFIVFLIVFRSLRLGLLAMIPNLLPILCNFGLMGYAGIPLNSATAIISAVAIGIAVDDTIHFVCHYQSGLKGGLPVADAVRRTLVVKGMPIITTSIIMVAAYSLLLAASFVPTIQFGFLSALIMLFAVVADLMVLPAVLLI